MIDVYVVSVVSVTFNMLTEWLSTCGRFNVRTDGGYADTGGSVGHPAARTTATLHILQQKIELRSVRYFCNNSRRWLVGIILSMHVFEIHVCVYTLVGFVYYTNRTSCACVVLCFIQVHGEFE